MFKYKAKRIIRNFRVILLLIFLVLAIVAINPRPGVDGVAIRSVLTDSAASGAGIAQPSPTSSPISRERILGINNRPINSISDYYDFINGIEINQSLQIKTDKALYRLTVREGFDTIELEGTTFKIVEEIIKVNETVDGNITEVQKKVNKTIEVPKTKQVSIGVEDIGIRVFTAPKTNIRKGLDLQGGTRVLLQPEFALFPEDLQTLIDNMEERLNVYGLSDLVIRDASDLAGNQYILVEIAGANEEEIKDLLAKQGKFEAKVANQTVFSGGEDIVFVCRSADCAGIDPSYGCSKQNGQDLCRFRFSITITQEAAQKQALVTKDIPIIGGTPTSSGRSSNAYLAEPLKLYMDDTLVDELNIGSELAGSPVTEIQISGSGAGRSQDEAVFNALNNMKRLQTFLITGSLPVKLDIVKIDTISPLLGQGFLKNAMLAGLFALLAVGIMVFTIYRKLAVAIPMILVSVSEVIILMGVAAMIGWNIDLAAVAGIIIAVGTGIDHQIVIADETLRSKRQVVNWKDRIKSAFFIIMASYFTVVVALIPLMFAGAGLLKGFAITTILGASIGVFISRPVFARVIEILVRN